LLAGGLTLLPFACGGRASEGEIGTRASGGTNGGSGTSGTGGAGGTQGIAGTGATGAVTGSGGTGVSVADSAVETGVIGTGGSGGNSRDSGLALDSGPLSGCRSPSEPGCAECCDWTGEACLLRSSAPFGVSGPPLYNSIQYLFSACPAGCARCASCLLEYERELEIMGCRADCNCPVIEAGIDPCFRAGSCACYCSRVEALVTSCPELSPCPARSMPN